MALRNTALALAAAVSLTTLSAPAMAQEAEGRWTGALEVAPGTRLPLLVHIRRDDAGTLTGTMDSPTQGAFGLLLGDVSADNGTLGFTVPRIGGTYKGQWDAEAKRW